MWAGLAWFSVSQRTPVSVGSTRRRTTVLFVWAYFTAFSASSVTTMLTRAARSFDSMTEMTSLFTKERRSRSTRQSGGNSTSIRAALLPDRSMWACTGASNLSRVSCESEPSARALDDDDGDVIVLVGHVGNRRLHELILDQRGPLRGGEHALDAGHVEHLALGVAR